MPDHQPVFSGKKIASHMPFFDGTTLVFCDSGTPKAINFEHRGTIWKSMRGNLKLAERLKDLPKSTTVNYRAWKLAYCNWNDKIVHRIATGLPDEAIECSPAFYRENNHVHLSFIAGVPSDKGIFYKLYTTSGPDFSRLEAPQPQPYGVPFFGFVSPYHVCWGVRNLLYLKEKATGLMLRFKCDFARILRVTFCSETPSRLLITGVDTKYQFRTLLHDLSASTTQEVVSNDKTGAVKDGLVYKSSIYKNEIIHARRLGSGFEDRELFHGDYTLLSSSLDIIKGE
jgi:hypothetical protein